MAQEQQLSAVRAEILVLISLVVHQNGIPENIFSRAQCARLSQHHHDFVLELLLGTSALSSCWGGGLVQYLHLVADTGLGIVPHHDLPTGLPTARNQFASFVRGLHECAHPRMLQGGHAAPLTHRPHLHGALLSGCCGDAVPAQEQHCGDGLAVARPLSLLAGLPQGSHRVSKQWSQPQFVLPLEVVKGQRPGAGLDCGAHGFRPKAGAGQGPLEAAVQLRGELPPRLPQRHSGELHGLFYRFQIGSLRGHREVVKQAVDVCGVELGPDPVVLLELSGHLLHACFLPALGDVLIEEFIVSDVVPVPLTNLRDGRILL
eukprot:RCo041301